MDGLKPCTICHVAKPETIEFFYSQKGCRNGLTPRCRECAKAYAKKYFASLDAAGRKKYAAANKKWWSEHPEQRRAYHRSRRLADPIAARARDARDRKGRGEQRRKDFKRWYETNCDKKLADTRRWRKENPEIVKRNYDAWRSQNPESYKATRKRAHTTFFSKPRNRLDRKVRAGIHKYLTGKGVSRSWQSKVGYTLDQLSQHVERQFDVGMTWDNMGDWHLDHILPLSSFSYQTPDDPDFMHAWSLSNLRPIWAKQNLSKGTKRTLLI